MRQKEAVLILIVLAIASGALYYFLFFTTYTVNRDQTQEQNMLRREEMVRARHDRDSYAYMLNRLAVVEEEWLVATADIPLFFDDIDVLARIQGIVYPYTRQVAISIGSTEERADTLLSTVVQINFISSYGGFLSILDGLAEEDIDNRIINYDISVLERLAHPIENTTISVVLHVEYISQAIEVEDYNEEGDDAVS